MADEYVSESAPASHVDMAQDEWLKGVCKIGQGHECCRYVVCGPNGFECAKHDPSLAPQLNFRVFCETINARGNNCPGVQRAG